MLAQLEQILHSKMVGKMECRAEQSSMITHQFLGKEETPFLTILHQSCKCHKKLWDNPKQTSQTKRAPTQCQALTENSLNYPQSERHQTLTSKITEILHMALVQKIQRTKTDNLKYRRRRNKLTRRAGLHRVRVSNILTLEEVKVRGALR
ncbi:hypothetical protein FGO68_gene17461 [Halteria grandinella]|uniref:Uncharacterized protein n=1 Tax=Halteria grandinella TaxID=5974 RepID=A0A8J8P2D6_HALGN|nr:hypothetical protein FGO68_gene17461 [Halteria grandinella]